MCKYYSRICKFLSLFALLLLLWFASQPASATTNLGRNQEAGPNEFIVTDFYIPRGWMLNSVGSDRFSFNDTFNENCVGATPCIKISWRQPQQDEWIGLYWVHPAAGVGDWPAIGQPGCDLTGATSVTVWARGERGNEKISWLAAFYANRRIETPPVTLTTQWQQYTIDLGTIDLTNVVGAFGYTLDGVDNQEDTVVYLDKIAYQGITANQLSCIGNNTATPTATAPQPTTPTPTPTPTTTPEAKTLVLIYAGLDNNLGIEDNGINWIQLINNLEKGVHNDVIVRFLLDIPGADNAYVYDLMYDDNPFCPHPNNLACNQRYVLGENLHKWTEDTADAESLYTFIKESLLRYPNTAKRILTLIGHGSGWHANGLPDLPTRWGEQSGARVGGFLWDDTTGGQSGTRALSTKSLAEALLQATTEAQTQFDLLYLDACSMGMVEVAYELKASAHYLLVSPNTDWASFPYHHLLTEVTNERDGRALGQAWLQTEAGLLRNNRYPFTLALLDLKQMDKVRTSVNTLATTLIAAWPTQSHRVMAANQLSDRYESNYDGALSSLDSYMDLYSFSQQVATNFGTDAPMTTAVQGVQDALNQAVIAKDFNNGKPWLYPNQTWQWRQFGGISLYLPATAEPEKLALYTDNNLAWAKDSTWDEFLNTYWSSNNVAMQRMKSELPNCSTTAACADILPRPMQLHKVFMPLINH